METNHYDSFVFDDLNLKILKKFYFLDKDEEITTWTIMKAIFPEIKKLHEKRSKHELIKLRIKSMNPDLFFIHKNTKTKKLEYELISDNIMFTKHKFPNGYRNSLLVKILGLWQIYEL